MHKGAILLLILCGALLGGTALVLYYLLFTAFGAKTTASLGHIPLGLSETAESAGVAEPLVNAASAALWDTQEQRLVYHYNAFERRPVASLTKLMTAMVALDYGMAWDKEMTIAPTEYGRGGNLLLHPGETVTIQDLFNASLVGSANNATLAYVRGLDIDSTEFVRAMNRKAIELGLEQTEFTDVTGLSPQNLSTAYEVARFSEAAFRQYPAIAAATSQAEYVFSVGGSGREHRIGNTNKLVADKHDSFGGSKTGYLDEALYCLVVTGQGTWQNRIAVVLGSPSQERNELDTFSLLRLK